MPMPIPDVMEALIIILLVRLMRMGDVGVLLEPIILLVKAMYPLLVSITLFRIIPLVKGIQELLVIEIVLRIIRFAMEMWRTVVMLKVL